MIHKRRRYRSRGMIELMAEPDVSTSPKTRRHEIEIDSSATDRVPPSAGTQTDDDSLILWMLSLTPTGRLEMAQGFVDSVIVLRNGRRLS